MLLLYYIILSILEPFLSFSMLYDCMTVTVTCVMLYVTCDITSHLLPKFKIKKSKIKPKIK